MFEQECVPFAPSLIESMRSLGYSFPAAIADLLDNSISAKAKNIDIISTPGMEPSLIILDDGYGMTNHELEMALKFGSKNPLDERREEDLSSGEWRWNSFLVHSFPIWKKRSVSL